MTIGWITDPPISLAGSKEEAVLALRTLKANMKDWTAPPIPGRPGRDADFEEAAWDVWPAERRAWNARRAESRGLIVDMIEELGDDDVWVYRIGGAPIGVMIIYGCAGYLHIEYLVTHVGSKDCGGVLIQKAVTLSVAAGFHGRVRLFAGNENAASMYAHMGFVEKDEGVDNMELVPANQPAKWQPTATGYCYIPYLGGGWAS
ncbi:MAG: hypothetical protein JWO38_1116 [Gemmataceae bacterium]|nr:hypothetical protein [Gemmataceae bacterium]